MTIADRLAAPSVRSQPCALGRLIAAADQADAEALTAALADPAFSTADIHRAIRNEGHTMSYPVVQRHRTGGCGCGNC